MWLALCERQPGVGGGQGVPEQSSPLSDSQVKPGRTRGRGLGGVREPQECAEAQKRESMEATASSKVRRRARACGVWWCLEPSEGTGVYLDLRVIQDWDKEACRAPGVFSRFQEALFFKAEPALVLS